MPNPCNFATRFLLGLALVTGVARAADPATPPVTTRRVLTVHVVDAKTSKPVAGATIYNSTGQMRLAGKTPKPEETVTDAEGVAQTILQVPPPEIARQMNYVSVIVSNASYAPRTANWASQSGSVLDDIPNEVTIRLLQGTNLGGIVKDWDGKPLGGAKIFLSGQSSEAMSRVYSQKQFYEISSFPYFELTPDSPGVTQTDKNGRWSVTNAPPDIDAISISVLRPDGSDASFATQFPPNYPVNPSTKQISLTELRAGAVVFDLPRGYPVRGRVIDAQGKPVAKAKILEYYGMNGQQQRGTSLTDTSGRFELPNRRLRQVGLTAEADGYALSSVIATITTNTPEVVIQLSSAKPATLRVLLDNNEPAVGASAMFLYYRTDHTFARWSETVGASGTLVWTNAPLEPSSIQIQGPNGVMRNVTLTAGKETKVILSKKQPSNSVKISLLVQNAADKTPVKSFDVQMEKNWSQQFASIAEGTNGRAEVGISSSDFGVNQGGQFRLKIVSTNYAAWTSDQFQTMEGDRELVVNLDPDVPLAGVVLTPEGKPAEGGWIMVGDSQSPLYLNEEFQRKEVRPPNGGRGTKIELGADATYRLDSLATNANLIAIHESGFAQTTPAQLRGKKELKLEPWGEVDGILKIGAQNAKEGQALGLHAIQGGRMGGLSVYYRAQTDAEGHFNFNRVPPGNYKLFRYLDNMPGTIIYSHRQDIEVKAGETIGLQLGGNGVRVTGRVRPDKFAEIDWKVNKQFLVAGPASANQTSPGARVVNGPAVAWEDFVRRGDYEAATRTQPATATDPKQYTLTFEEDGSFFVDDVEPGTYNLNLRVTEPPTQRYNDEGKLIGTLATNISLSLPAGKTLGDQQLPTLTLKVISETAITGLPSLQVEQPDGKLLDLTKQKGRTQIVLFWAPWSEQSTGALKTFQDTLKALPANSPISGLVVAMDDNAEEVKAALVAAGWKGATARLTGANFLNVMATHALRELPTIMVIDPEGNLVSRLKDSAKLKSLIESTANRASVK